jgi:hypothetical protein
MFSDNREMIGVARKIGFDVRYDEDAHSCTATLDLSGKTHQPFTQAR